MSKLSIVLTIILSLVIVVFYYLRKEKSNESLEKDYKSVAVENSLSQHRISKERFFYSYLQAQFLLDTFANKNTEEYILIYISENWCDTYDYNYTIKIIFDKLNKAYFFQKIDFINCKNESQKKSFYKLSDSHQKELTEYYIYYKDAKQGKINNNDIKYFLSDSIYQYKDRKISSTGIGYFHLAHLKEINDTLKFYKYDLTPAFDKESIRLEKLLNLIKEETSK